jgi:8-oxo-dGTP diphosphatase
VIETVSGHRHRIVAGALVLDRRVLLCHRSASKEWFPNVWDLPGGHIEVGESPGNALARELREELEIDIAAPRDPCLARVLTDEFEMHVWRITKWSGTPRNGAPEEHDEIAWFALPEARMLGLAHASYAAMLEGVLSLR